MRLNSGIKIEEIDIKRCHLDIGEDAARLAVFNDSLGKREVAELV